MHSNAQGGDACEGVDQMFDTHMVRASHSAATESISIHILFGSDNCVQKALQHVLNYLCYCRQSQVYVWVFSSQGGYCWLDAVLKNDTDFPLTYQRLSHTHFRSCIPHRFSCYYYFFFLDDSLQKDNER